MKYAVIAAYASSAHAENEILSVHASYEAAERAARGFSDRAIREAPEGAKKGANIRELEIAEANRATRFD